MDTNSFPPPGGLRLDCGDSGTMKVTVVLDQDSDRNESNYAKIAEKWEGLWPKVYECVSRMRKDYKYAPAINAPDASLKFLLPSSPPDVDGTWEVSIELESDGAGEWSVAFSQWEIVPEDCQPYF